MTAPEHIERFDCFAGRCAVHVEGTGLRGAPAEAARWGRERMLGWHEQFSRFLPASELCRLNADPRAIVPASPLMVELAAAIRLAGELTDGVVDGTLLVQLEAAGYGSGDPEDLLLAPSQLATPSRRGWARIEVDRDALTISRPPGVRLDSGGLVKGLLADVLAGWLGSHEDVLVDCCGDLAIGGSDPAPRDVEIEHPLDGSIAGTVEVGIGGVATSGTTKRRWKTAGGQPAHHLIDPSTGAPAQSGLIQVTAVAPSALEAEVLAKWALLGGPGSAKERLPHGGLIIDDAGKVTVVASHRQGDAVPSTR